MECSHIREKLSAYLEDEISSDEKALVEEHLKSCAGCSDDLTDLKKIIKHIKGIEEVEPPAWLTQKVMGKIRAEARPKEGLFRKLFYPLHVKLPIEAVAALLIVGLALYIYRDIRPEMKLAKAPTEESSTQVLPAKQQPSLTHSEDKNVTPPVLPLDKGRSEEGFSRKTAPALSRPAEQPSSSGEMEAKADDLARSGIKDTEKRERAGTPAPPKSLERSPAAGAIAKDEARQAAGAAAPQGKLSYMEKKEEPLLLTVTAKDPETAVKEIEKTLKELEIREIRAESAEGKRIITTVLTFSKVRQLYEKLKVIGDIREKELDVKGQEGDIILRIEVIKNP